MDKLELKHIAPYLPYKLQWYFEGEDFSHEVIGIELNTVHLLSPYNDYGRCTLNEGKPILRPLSDLTKLINYGLSSYIFIELFEIGDTDGFIYEFDSGNIKLLNSLESISIHNNSHDINYLPYPVVEMMYEKHFDVFGLIEQGLAIDINTLNK